MPGPFPPESSPSRVGFGADVASAADALIRQPSVPLVSLALVLFPGDTSRSGDHSAVATLLITAATFTDMLFYAGWLGAEGVFFQRRLEGKPVSLPHLLRLVKPFVSRFLVLGVFFGIVFLSSFFALADILGMDITHLPDTAAQLPFSFQVWIAVLAIVTDFSLTFVTPALAYTTRSAVRSVGIGFAMIGQTWPRSALYVLCPPLALNLLNYIFPVGGLALQLLLTSVVTLVGLLAKGAIAAFYLRERGSYSEDGAAYRVPPDRRRPPLAHLNEAPTVSP